MRDFRQTLAAGERLLFDGAMGTVLQSRGLAPGQNPEKFCLERPDILMAIHGEYAAAGARVITTNTFGGTRFKLPPDLAPLAFNRRMAEIARAAADAAAAATGRRVFVAGSVGPTGLFLRPLGDLAFEDMAAAFQEQIRGLMLGGVDLILAETHFDIAEARAVVVAARREGRLPVGVSMTYEEGRTLTGSDVAVCAATLGNLGVDIIAMNCSAGPVEMRQAALELLRLSPASVLVQPNAGLPELRQGETHFPLGPEKFAELTAEFAAAGAQAVGGCCGTSPAHIAALGAAVASLEAPGPRPVPCSVALTSRSQLLHIGADQPLRMIGERINPTGKKQLSAELKAGEFTTALRFADEQIAAGALILDVNVGAPMVDESLILPDLVRNLLSRCNVPLAIDSSNMEAVEKALAAYPASALVNSISGEAGRMERLGPLCRDFGAPFILLPLKGGKLPVKAAERIAILETLLQSMESLGVPRSLALVDALVLAVSSSPEAASECLDFIRYCTRQLGLPVVTGLSNVSFGLPARALVNAAFLGLAAGAGMNACIANPSDRRLGEALDAANLLLNHDADAETFIGRYSAWTGGDAGTGGVPGAKAPTGASATPGAPATPAASPGIEEAVLLGRRSEIPALVRQALESGEEPFALVNGRLIPAISEVGDRYARKEYFLPQLIRSAESMQEAFALLRPLLEKDARSGQRPVVVLATVEGDIHDIGKNIVSLMLGNHGFEIADLGKDVSAARIVEEAIRRKAALIGLSALMTTTMVRMRDTVDLLGEKSLSIPVMVGGAVVTGDFALAIGAHYAPDAVQAVKLARSLLQAGGL
ncbi:homocysteine S-methyltransferase family protein [Desulfovibrio sp. OttesenSCG-928-G11]|nr:homocysteine S-methyltransferase family protein [Desulfovibrio sp. OttesenSCG-928-G11]